MHIRIEIYAVRFLRQSLAVCPGEGSGESIAAENPLGFAPGRPQEDGFARIPIGSVQ